MKSECIFVPNSNCYRVGELETQKCLLLLVGFELNPTETSKHSAFQVLLGTRDYSIFWSPPPNRPDHLESR